MFAKKLQHQNSFLRLTCPNYEDNLIHNGMSEILFRHLSPTLVMQQRSIVKECLDFQEKYNRGYERIGFEDLVSC